MPEILYPINPDRNKPWNDLPLLPIKKELYRTIEIIEQLGEAKAALARLQGRSAILPNQGLLVNTISLQEAKLSSQIENIFTTDDELYKAFSDNNKNVQGAAKEVLRYKESLWVGYNYLKENGKFDEDYFIKVFQQIKQTNEGIRPNFSNVVIRKSGSGINAGQVIYTPPRGNQVILDKLENLIAFLNDDEKYAIDHLLKMAIAHYQFEAIHPFRDGNGRTGRVLNINFLTDKNLLEFPILFMSRYILEHKNDYYAGLEGVSQRGNWKAWLLFMLRAVEQTATFTYHKINEITQARDSILEYIIKEKNNIRKPESLVNAIFTQPMTRVKHLVNDGIYAENTARNYLNELSEIGVLEKKRIEGGHYYLNLELYHILSN